MPNNCMPRACVAAPQRAAGACRQALTAAGAWTLDHSIGLGACVRSAVGRVGLRAAGRCAGDASSLRAEPR